MRSAKSIVMGERGEDIPNLGARPVVSSILVLQSRWNRDFRPASSNEGRCRIYSWKRIVESENTGAFSLISIVFVPAISNFNQVKASPLFVSIARLYVYLEACELRRMLSEWS